MLNYQVVSRLGLRRCGTAHRAPDERKSDKLVMVLAVFSVFSGIVFSRIKILVMTVTVTNDL